MNRIAIISLLLLSSCYLSDEIAPDQITWTYNHPKEVGLREGQLLSINTELENNNFGVIYGLLIVKEGQLVFENYYNYSYRKEIKPIGQATFAIISLLFDHFLSNNLIESKDQPIYELLPEYADIFEKSPLKKQITLQHILDNKSGLVWNEVIVDINNPESDFQKMKESDDWVQYVLEAPLASIPGQRTSTHSGAGILLCKIFEGLLVNQSLESFIQKELFTPLNITSYIWRKDPTGTLNGADGLYLSALDYTKFGYLALLDGRWTQKERIVSRDWIYDLLNPSIKINENYSYSKGWWKFEKELINNYTFNANTVHMINGDAGKNIFIIPDESMVVTVFAQNPEQHEIYNPSLSVLTRVMSSIISSNSTP